MEPLEWQGARIRFIVAGCRCTGKSGMVRFIWWATRPHSEVSTVGGIVTGFRGALGVAQALLHDGKSPELGALRRELVRIG